MWERWERTKEFQSGKVYQSSVWLNLVPAAQKGKVLKPGKWPTSPAACPSESQYSWDRYGEKGKRFIQVLQPEKMADSSPLKSFQYLRCIGQIRKGIRERGTVEFLEMCSSCLGFSFCSDVIFQRVSAGHLWFYCWSQHLYSWNRLFNCNKNLARCESTGLIIYFDLL